MPINIIMPKVDMVMDEGTVAKWHKSEGDQVQAGEPLFDIATDKATMEVEAPASGTLAQISALDGATVPVATVIALILEPGEQPLMNDDRRTATASSLALGAQSSALSPQSSKARATPLARSLARAHGLDITLLSGGGPQGRVRKDDVLQAIATQRAASRPSSNGTPSSSIAVATPAPEHIAPAGARSADGSAEAGRLVPLIGVRKIIAQRLVI